MIQIASKSKNSMNLNRCIGSHFSGFARKTLSRTPRELAEAVSETSAVGLCPPYSFAQAGRKRYFCETTCIFLDSKVLSADVTQAKNDGDLKYPGAKSNTFFEGSDYISNHKRQHDIALEKFTHFALNSPTIPLGSMHEENWLDVLDAIDAWLNIGGGFATDSAERLLERLVNEHAASFSRKKSICTSSYSHRSRILADLQRDILNSWLDISARSREHSKLSIIRADQAFFQLLDLQSMVETSTTRMNFPIEEFITIIEGYLNLHQQYDEGVMRAGTLILKLASNSKDAWDLAMEDHGLRIGNICEKCATQLLTIDSTHSIVSPLLKIMTNLKQSGVCPDIDILDTEGRLIVKATSQEDRNPEMTTTSEMSPFELEVAEKRLLGVLKEATTNEKSIVDSLVQKLNTTKPTNDVIIALIEYYVRIGDSESASHWLQKLDNSFLVSTFDLVERVLESWLDHDRSRAPWRADEFFKAVIRKIRQNDEDFVMSTKSYELIIRIWNASDDPSSSRKILDLYSQMRSQQVKPDVATLKMTILALSRIQIDNPLELVLNDILRQWDSFTRGDKAEIAGAMFEILALKKDNSDVILKVVERLQGESGIDSKRLMQSAFSAIRIDASPSDVLGIVCYFNDTAEKIDLSVCVLAIDTLFKLNEDSESEIRFVYDDVMRRITADRDKYDANDISEFLFSVTSMHIHRKLFGETERLIQKAEELFLSTDKTKNKHSIIPLKCYKKLIVRNWYSAKTAQKVEELFVKLLELYHSGYSNLQPDCDLYTAYIDARSLLKKNVEQDLEEMIQEYELCGQDNMKPQTKVFNTVLLSLSKDEQNAPKLYKKSIDLLNRMLNLNVQPDIKTFNLVLRHIIKNNQNVYERSMMIVKMIEENNLSPDSHTLHLIIDACGSATSNDREDALKMCLTKFGEIREQDFVNQITYGVVSKVAYRLTSDRNASQIGSILLPLCCNDGMLKSDVRGRLQAMMSDLDWEQHYVRRLSIDNVEPTDWSRNIKTP